VRAVSKELIEFKATVYTREKLERELRELNNDLRELREALENLRHAFAEVLDFIYYKTIVSTETFTKITKKFDELKQAILDAINESIVNKLELDVDIEKYNVKFTTYESEKPLGVALMQNGETVRPVIVYTDYITINYRKGEESE
jgi:predicted nuclease with TOPRIM domain